MIKVSFPYDSIRGDELVVKARARKVSAYDCSGLDIQVEDKRGTNVNNLLPSKDWDTIEEIALEELQKAQEEEGLY